MPTVMVYVTTVTISHIVTFHPTPSRNHSPFSKNHKRKSISPHRCHTSADPICTKSFPNSGVRDTKSMHRSNTPSRVPGTSRTRIRDDLSSRKTSRLSVNPISWLPSHMVRLKLRQARRGKSDLHMASGKRSSLWKWMKDLSH